MTSQNETLQRCRFGNVVWRFHRHYMATSEQRWIAMSQQRCNYVIASTGIVVSNIFSTEKAFQNWQYTQKFAATDVIVMSLL